MKNKLNKLSRLKDESGSANSVSFLVIVFFISIMLISFLDVGLYFNIKGQVQDAAENGARNVALYGGTGSGNSLRGAIANSSAEDVAYTSIPTSFTDGSVLILEPIKAGDIVCGVIEGNKQIVPDRNTEAAGDAVGCEITYKYKGLAGKLGMFQLAGKDYNVIGTSVSEVSFK